jgi:hypothetical protein
MNHVNEARELFAKGYNCSQSILATFGKDYLGYAHATYS